MIKVLFYTFIILLAAIGLGFLIHQDPGYAMISYHHWIIATSVWVALTTIVISFVLLYFFIRLFKNVMALPKIFSRARKIANANRYHAIITQAMTAFATGAYAKAEKYFVKSARRSDAPAANYLMAAEAAHLQDKIKTRDQYLEKAKEHGGDIASVKFLK